MRRSGASLAVALAALSLAFPAAFPAAARAGDAPRTDPEVGSPAEEVYGIPLEEARRDGAPGVLVGPAIRTENQVGSSSVVPGRGRAADAPPVLDREELKEQRRVRRLQAARAAERLSGSTSPVASGLVLALVLVIAACGGTVAGRLTRRPAR